MKAQGWSPAPDRYKSTNYLGSTESLKRITITAFNDFMLFVSKDLP